MKYQYKYLQTPKYTLDNPRPAHAPGRIIDPLNWGDEEAIIERDRYYALLKHRAQAAYRGEEHTLTNEQWCEIWTLERWRLRGRERNSLCLAQIDPEKGWHKDNVEVVERMEVLRRNKEYRAKNK